MKLRFMQDLIARLTMFHMLLEFLHEKILPRSPRIYLQNAAAGCARNLAPLRMNKTRPEESDLH